MRYVVDLRNSLQAPCGGDGSSTGGTRRDISSRGGLGNVGILKGFPKSVGRVGSRHHGFPCFPYSVISMACFLPGDAGFTATSTSATRRARHETLIVIGCR